MSGYSEDIRLERRFSKVVKGILGNCFIGQSQYLDHKRATDFAMFSVEPFSVGVRLRTYYYYTKWPNQFTIRWSRPSGVETEIHKIRKGLVDYILYGFVNADESKIVKYFIGDLDVFRMNEPPPIGVYPNKPPDSELAAFRISDLPPEFVVHRWERPEDNND